LVAFVGPIDGHQERLFTLDVVPSGDRAAAAADQAAQHRYRDRFLEAAGKYNAH
jgi:hypothetical protein